MKAQFEFVSNQIESQKIFNISISNHPDQITFRKGKVDDADNNIAKQLNSETGNTTILCRKSVGRAFYERCTIEKLLRSMSSLKSFR